MTSRERDVTLEVTIATAPWHQTCGAWLTRLFQRRTTTARGDTHYVILQSGAVMVSTTGWPHNDSPRLLGYLSKTPQTPIVVTTPSTLNFVSGGRVWRLRLESQGHCSISMDDDGFSLRSSAS